MELLIHALNVDTFNVRTITCTSSFGPNVQLHDYTGRHRDIWTGTVWRRPRHINDSVERFANLDKAISVFPLPTTI
jgi:hypothetical protein